MNRILPTKEASSSKSAAVKIDEWLWPELPVSRAVKTKQHMTPRCFNLKIMFAYRVIALIMLIVQIGNAVYCDYIDFSNPQVSYIRQTAILLNTFVFTLLSASHSRTMNY